MPVNIALIKKLREAKGLTQAEAAAKAGMSRRQNWNALERGRVKNLTVNTLERVAKALGVEAYRLLK